MSQIDNQDEVVAILSARDLELLRLSIALSHESRSQGRHPFAALVADARGDVVATAGNNSMPPEGDPTQHAELVVAAQAARKLTPETLAQCTLYTSAEPCCMCSGAIYWTGIGRVVYALSEAALLELRRAKGLGKIAARVHGPQCHGAGAHRLGKEVALQLVAAEPNGMVALGLVFDAFGHHAQPAPAGHRNDLLDSAARLGVAGQCAHQGAADLDFVQRQARQRSQATGLA